MKHKHAEVIKAWADGAEIQTRAFPDGEWSDVLLNTPKWWEDHEYRVKPEPKQLWARPYVIYGPGRTIAGRYVMSRATKEECEYPDGNWIGPAVLIWEEK